MASPLPTAKPTVDLAASGGVRVSRIRRDPPPKVKEVTVADIAERDTRTVVLGILLFGLAIAVILIGLGSTLGWSPREVVAHI
jgi:hypothetical protein